MEPWPGTLVAVGLTPNKREPKRTAFPVSVLLDLSFSFRISDRERKETDVTCPLEKGTSAH